MNEPDIPSLFAELLATATEVIQKRYQPGRHHIASALKTTKGKIFSSVHLEPYIGRSAMCAEPLAIAAAFSELDNPEIEALLAVRHPSRLEPDQTIRLVSPCGACRELMLEYAPSAKILLHVDGLYKVVTVRELLPRFAPRL